MLRNFWKSNSFRLLSFKSSGRCTLQRSLLTQLYDYYSGSGFGTHFEMVWAEFHLPVKNAQNLEHWEGKPVIVVNSAGPPWSLKSYSECSSNLLIYRASKQLFDIVPEGAEDAKMTTKNFCLILYKKNHAFIYNGWHSDMLWVKTNSRQKQKLQNT